MRSTIFFRFSLSGYGEEVGVSKEIEAGMIAMYLLHTSRVFAKNTSVSRIFGEDFMIAKYRVAEVLAHC